MSTISLVVAASQNGVIGRDGAMPWHLPADLKHFKSTTIGKPIIMGRRTFEAIGRALPERRNIVVSRRGDIKAEHIDIAHSFEDALALGAYAQEVMVIGGGELYHAALPLAGRVYLTRIHADIEGDTFFPDLSPDEWREVTREKREPDDKNVHALSFIVLERIKNAL